MEKPAQNTYPIHDLLRLRWSPRAFASRPVEADKLRGLLEAARWSPSASNEQPWSFLVVTHAEPEAFGRLVSCLMEGNQAWAGSAPVLILSVARLTSERTGQQNRYAWYDVGQAVAHLTLQAAAEGLFVHQMAGFYADKAREAFGIPDGYDPVSVTAVGYPGDHEALSEKLRERELAPRSRKPLRDFVFTNRWGAVSPLVEDAGAA